MYISFFTSTQRCDAWNLPIQLPWWSKDPFWKSFFSQYTDITKNWKSKNPGNFLVTNGYHDETPSHHQYQWLIQENALKIQLEWLSNLSADSKDVGYTQPGCAGHSRALVTSYVFNLAFSAGQDRQLSPQFWNDKSNINMFCLFLNDNQGQNILRTSCDQDEQSRKWEHQLVLKCICCFGSEHKVWHIHYQ